MTGAELRDLLAALDDDSLKLPVTMAFVSPGLGEDGDEGVWVARGRSSWKPVEGGDRDVPMLHVGITRP